MGLRRKDKAFKDDQKWCWLRWRTFLLMHQVHRFQTCVWHFTGLYAQSCFCCVDITTWKTQRRINETLVFLTLSSLTRRRVTWWQLRAWKFPDSSLNEVQTRMTPTTITRWTEQPPHCRAPAPFAPAPRPPAPHLPCGPSPRPLFILRLLPVFQLSGAEN